MKILKYIVALVAVLLIVFFGNGLITPSITYGSQITVDKPVNEAWAVMSDGSRVSEWLQEITRMESVSGVPGTVGAVSKIYASQDGEEWVMVETITAVTPEEYIAMTFTMDFMNMDYSMTLKDVDGKTQITSTSTTTGNGLFAKSIVSFMTGTMKEQEDKNLNNLKAVIDGNTVDYFPAPEEVLEDNLVDTTVVEIQ